MPFTLPFRIRATLCAFLLLIPILLFGGYRAWSEEKRCRDLFEAGTRFDEVTPNLDFSHSAGFSASGSKGIAGKFELVFAGSPRTEAMLTISSNIQWPHDKFRDMYSGVSNYQKKWLQLYQGTLSTFRGKGKVFLRPNAELPLWAEELDEYAESITKELVELEQYMDLHHALKAHADTFVDTIMKKDEETCIRVLKPHCNAITKWTNQLTAEYNQNHMSLPFIRHVRDELQGASRYIHLTQAWYAGSWSTFLFAWSTLGFWDYGVDSLGSFWFTPLWYTIWFIICSPLVLYIGLPLCSFILRSLWRSLKSIILRNVVDKDAERHYDRLQIARNATEQQIEDAFTNNKKRISASAAIDPDDKRTALQLLQDAFDVLSNPVRRAEYDQRYGYNIANKTRYAKRNDAHQFYTSIGLNPTRDKEKIAQQLNALIAVQGESKSIGGLNTFLARKVLLDDALKPIYDEEYGYNMPGIFSGLYSSWTAIFQKIKDHVYEKLVEAFKTTDEATLGNGSVQPRQVFDDKSGEAIVMEVLGREVFDVVSRRISSSSHNADPPNALNDTLPYSPSLRRSNLQSSAPSPAPSSTPSSPLSPRSTRKAQRGSIAEPFSDGATAQTAASENAALIVDLKPMPASHNESRATGAAPSSSRPPGSPRQRKRSYHNRGRKSSSKSSHAAQSPTVPSNTVVD